MTRLVLFIAINGLAMGGLTFWYYLELRKTEGGRQLLQEEVRLGRYHRIRLYGPLFVRVHPRTIKAIANGHYGVRVKQVSNRMYLLVGLWLIVSLLMFWFLFLRGGTQ
ncbi:hypothetical protein FHP25_35360 [Vineibacter terrae]|uniref:Uncharacterized protein n=1 Tax=Vineibacter terrae TaxID=2586908 RepID=A0A5C8PAE5_9HYPH|nr:hypothetical protein [Vineibacter terrae]TXL70213.1 hypothetical protein FHP25_35360 [Vineibacter terrae]